jgi:hypothetical protein
MVGRIYKHIVTKAGWQKRIFTFYIYTKMLNQGFFLRFWNTVHSTKSACQNTRKISVQNIVNELWNIE